MRFGRRPALVIVVAGLSGACGISVMGTLDDHARDLDAGTEASLPSAPDGGAFDSGAATESGVDAAEEASAPFACPSDAGPMVQTDAGFCVDVTEVTNAQFLPFFEATKVAVPPPPPGCAWNVDFQPSTWRAVAPYFSDGDIPVHAVDWCDAWSYCAWAGKRLCGDLNGVAASAAEAADASANAWTYACSSGGATTYPYGDAYRSGACNGDGEIGAPSKAGSLAGCVGGGVYDMSGNMWEWDDSCLTVTGPGDSCRVRGGSLTRPELQLRCATSFATPRSDGAGNNGIRCCAYPP